MKILERSGDDPGPGYYPVPDRHHRHTVERRWDGEVWTGEVRPAPDGTDLPKYRRRPFHFLHDPGWKLLLVFVVSLGIASALWATDRDADWVHGIQIPMPLFSLVSTVAVMTALVLFLSRRVGFDRIPAGTRRAILKWGIASGVAGVAFALVVEYGVPAIFGDGPRDGNWAAIAGPAEETGKVLLPVVLWLKGRFRLPREGYFLVVVSACAFGVAESCEYAFNPDHWIPSRGFLEVMHPLLTGFIAAVAWQAAWRRDSIFTGAAFGAWAIAMFMHSLNDFIVLDGPDIKALGAISMVTVLVMYLLQKHSARQLVPPDRVAEVSTRWRPAAPASRA
jgi:hypothetical protein